MHLSKAGTNLPPIDFVPCHLATIKFIPTVLNRAKKYEDCGEKKKKEKVIFHHINCHCINSSF